MHCTFATVEHTGRVNTPFPTVLLSCTEYSVPRNRVHHLVEDVRSYCKANRRDCQLHIGLLVFRDIK